jgi:hypothetical protein
MDLIREFLDPIPLAALIVAVFALATIIVFAKIFRMPDSFAEREKVRDDLRFRIALERRLNLSNDDVEGDVEKKADAAEQEGDKGDKKETGAAAAEKKESPAAKA